MDSTDGQIIRRLYISDENKNVIRKVTVPGSKSITNRALLLAALSDKICTLEGALFSDDSRYFAKALMNLGFHVELDEENKKAIVYGNNGVIPEKQGKIYVGSAGTAARFLTAMLGFSDGEYVIDASEQMKKRPMNELFTVLEGLGARIDYLEEKGCLPVKIRGIFADTTEGMDENEVVDISLDISKSTQFLSAILMTASMIKKDVFVHITSSKKNGSYIEITRKVMSDFGMPSEFDGETYKVPYCDETDDEKEFAYHIEPDVSAASYFYAAAMICGLSVIVNGVYPDSMQGDMKFLKLLESMGGRCFDDNNGIMFVGPADGEYNGVDVYMNDFSDQALTLAVVAAYAKTPTRITGIGHIRGQESDRIAAIVNELNRAGIKCNELDDGVEIIPGTPCGAGIETYEDHRVAMAFSLLGLKTDGIIIKNPSCTRKTFEDYFEVLEGLYDY